MKPKKWVHLVSHSRSCSPFLPAHSGFFLLPPSPCSLAQTGFILPYASLLFRVLPSLQTASHLRPHACSRVKGSFLGVRGPSSRRPPSASNAPSQSHLPSAFPSSAFLTPSTVSSADGFVGLFHPTATSRVHSSGVCSSFAAVSPFSDRFPLVVVSNSLSTVAHRLHLSDPRPQGFHLRPNL